MQKVVEFLEKHVQWVALGLGALWLLFMAYTYVLNPPAKVDVGGQTLTAGKVDKYTVERAAAPLQAAINGTTAPEMPVESFAGAFQSTMNFEGAPEITLANNWRRNDVQFNPRTGGGGGGVTPTPGVPVPVGIALLPEPPVAATPADVAMGRSTIVPPVIPGQVAPALPAGQAAVAGAQPAGPATVDKDWVTQSFKIPVHEIGKQFAAANIKPGMPHATTAFLQVEMVRQEQLPSGEWDPKSEVVIKPLENGMVRVPFPAENAGRNLEHTYLNWAVANAGDILQPTFYQVTTGDPWHKPGAPIVQQAVFNPAAHVGGKGNLTDEQWKQVLDFRRQQYQQKQAQPQQRAPRQPRGPRGAPEMEDSGEMFAPRDPDREAFAQVRRPGPPRPPVYYEDPALMEDPAMYEGDMGMGAVMPNVPQAGVPGVDFPTGEFEPAKWPNPTMDCWAHDDTVQPGKTYRYKMRYRIKNPLYGTVNIAKNPKDATKFYLTSPDSPWGSAVSVPELTNFFIAAGRIQGAPKIRFDIFRFHGGVQEKLSMEAGPGDVIGKVDRDIDFKTRWTIVDFRSDGRQDNVILVDEDGNTVIRNVTNDRNNPLYKKLQEEIAARDATAALQPNGR